MATLVLLRHGQSVWNEADRFTGWVDVGLTQKGLAEAEAAGRELLERQIRIDVCHTSYLKRAIKTLWLAMEAMDRMWVPVHRHWRLNERHYGGLQGLNKTETKAKYGEDQVHRWRRSLKESPPPIETDSEHYPGNDPRYAGIDPADLPRGENLLDTVARVMPYWHEAIAPQLRKGQNVLVAAHGNSLRALIKELEGIGDDEINALEVATGQPLIYELDTALNVARNHRLEQKPGA